MGHTSCYNLVKHVETHFKKIYILFLRRPIMAVFEKVQEIIVEELGKEPSEVTLESTFEDLEADSLICSKLSLKLKML